MGLTHVPQVGLLHSTAGAASCDLIRRMQHNVSGICIRTRRGVKGAYSTGFKPMTHQQFMASPQNRARYWARSFRGWHEFAGVQPNAAHEALARLQVRGAATCAGARGAGFLQGSSGQLQQHRHGNGRIQDCVETSKQHTSSPHSSGCHW
jgi:hypothetical protein